MIENILATIPLLVMGFFGILAMGGGILIMKAILFDGPVTLKDFSISLGLFLAGSGAVLSCGYVGASVWAEEPSIPSCVSTGQIEASLTRVDYSGQLCFVLPPDCLAYLLRRDRMNGEPIWRGECEIREKGMSI